jgi:hypothetical protein
MARPAREHPLQAPPRFTPVDVDVDVVPEPSPTSASAPDPEPGRRSRLRSVGLGLGVGSAIGLAAVGIAFSILAVPLYFVASNDAGDHHHDLIHKGLFFVALPFGLVSGTLVGIAVGVWYGRGGRLPDQRDAPFAD